MTNEELAAQAKAGDKDALAQLWEQNRGLLAKLFGELAGKAGARMAAMGVTAEDIEQSFFLAVELAVRLYEPERGVLFASFLKYPVKTVFFDLVGWRTASQKCDPLGRMAARLRAVNWFPIRRRHRCLKMQTISCSLSNCMQFWKSASTTWETVRPQ